MSKIDLKKAIGETINENSLDMTSNEVIDTLIEMVAQTAKLYDIPLKTLNKKLKDASSDN